MEEEKTLEQTLLDIVDRKLVCGICLERPAAANVVEMMCTGKHTFCFPCCINYVKSTDDPTCPICRNGDGSVIESPFMKTLAKALERDEATEGGALYEYKKALPLLQSNYPGIFHDSNMITPSQMKVFSTYLMHPGAFTISTYVPPTRSPRDTDVVSNYLSVNIDCSSQTFCISAHTSIFAARRATTLAPETFSASFIIDDYNDVIFQSRPVQIYMVMPASQYITTTFPTPLSSVIIDQIEASTGTPLVAPTLVDRVRAILDTEEEE